MGALLDRVTSTYDIVLLDSPPLLPVTDAAVLSRQAGGLLVVAGVDRIHRPQLRETMESLETAGCHVVGVVINKIARREVGAYVYENDYYSAGDGVDDSVSARDVGRRVDTRACRGRGVRSAGVGDV